MDESDMLAAFRAGFALGREGRVDAELKPISSRTATTQFRHWYDRYDC